MPVKPHLDGCGVEGCGGVEICGVCLTTPPPPYYKGGGGVVVTDTSHTQVGSDQPVLRFVA